jgi:hypothetical protein
MTVRCGVDPDANAVDRTAGGHRIPPRTGESGILEATCAGEEDVSLLRIASGKAILVISGLGRKMYQNLKPKSEVAISPKRSMPQEVDISPDDTAAGMVDQLTAMKNIQGGGGLGAGTGDSGAAPWPLTNDDSGKSRARPHPRRPPQLYHPPSGQNHVVFLSKPA